MSKRHIAKRGYFALGLFALTVTATVISTENAFAQTRSDLGREAQQLSDSINDNFLELQELIDRISDQLANAPTTSGSAEPSETSAPTPGVPAQRLSTAEPCFGSLNQEQTYPEVKTTLDEVKVHLDTASRSLQAASLFLEDGAEAQCPQMVGALLDQAESELGKVKRNELLIFAYHFESCRVESTDVDERNRPVDPDEVFRTTRALLAERDDQFRRLKRGEEKCP